MRTREDADRVSRSRGFTLIEVLVTTSIMGLVAATIAAAFIVVIRTSPVNEERADDAGALLALTNWLPLDVASTDESEFTSGNTASSCTGVPASTGLLELKWSAADTYVANYRFLDKGVNAGTIVRYTCVQGSPAKVSKLSATMQKIEVSPGVFAPPVSITLFPNGVGGHNGLEFKVDILDPETNSLRELINLRAYTSNVESTLPTTTTSTLPPAVTTTSTTTTTAPNQPPVAPDFSMTVHVGAPYTVGMPATDPEGGVLTLVGTTPSSPDLTTTSPGGLDVTVTALVGPGPYSFTYTVSDPAGAQATGTVMVTVVVPPASTSTSTTTTTTTTTTTSTTTTTTIPCSATIVSVIPNSVVNETNSNGPTDVGRLKQDVKVTISKSGSCGQLVLAFDPDPLDGNSVQDLIAFGGLDQVTIPRAAYQWRDTNGTPHPLQIRLGANGAILNSAGLTVQ